MASPSKNVLVPIADGTEPIEAVVTIDVLRRAGANVTVASVGKEKQVDASWGVKLVADVLIADCAGSAFDLISLPVCFRELLRLLALYISCSNLKCYETFCLFNCNLMSGMTVVVDASMTCMLIGVLSLLFVFSGRDAWCN